MQITCGIFLYSTRLKKVLACHATQARWNSWSIPKGLKEEDEDAYTAAMRELYEETGIKLAAADMDQVRALPAVKYQKQNKELQSFLVISHKDFSEHTFSCHTLVEGRFPEVNKWKWISLDETGILHETQQRQVPLIRSLVANI